MMNAFRSESEYMHVLHLVFQSDLTPLTVSDPQRYTTSYLANVPFPFVWFICPVHRVTPFCLLSPSAMERRSRYYYLRRNDDCRHAGRHRDLNTRPRVDSVASRSSRVIKLNLPASTTKSGIKRSRTSALVKSNNNSNLPSELVRREVLSQHTGSDTTTTPTRRASTSTASRRSGH